MVNQLEMLYEGKAKKIYATDKEDMVIVHYKDDATAFNGEKKAQIESKGVLNNEITSLIFEMLNKEGIKTHFVEKLNDRDQLCKKVEIVPLEVIVRNVAAGSMAKRLGLEEGYELKTTVFELSYKDDSLGDPLINDYHAVGIGATTFEELNKIYDNLILVNEDDIPTKEQWKHLNECNIEKPEKSVYTLVKKENDLIDWYSALRDFQGNLNIYKSGLKYMTNSNDFIKNSLFCEYGYIINLDNKSLEFWIGFQKKPQKNNRYGITKFEGYYPCKLFHKMAFSKIQTCDTNHLIDFLEKKYDKITSR